MAPTSSWGYNAVDTVFKHVLRSLQGPNWQILREIRDQMKYTQADDHPIWDNLPDRFSSPITPTIPFVLALVGNPGVANAFPHRLLGNQWTDADRRTAMMTAFAAIDENQGVHIAPPSIFTTIHDSSADLLIMDCLKTVSNYGCRCSFYFRQ